MIEGTPPLRVIAGGSDTPERRIALALSILAHRPWCGADSLHVREVEQALLGGSIGDILGGRR